MGNMSPRPIGFIFLSGYMGQAKQNPDTGLSFTLLGIFLVSHSNFLGSSGSSFSSFVIPMVWSQTRVFPDKNMVSGAGRPAPGAGSSFIGVSVNV